MPRCPALLGLVALIAAGPLACEKAQQYPVVRTEKHDAKEKPRPPEVPAHYAWLRTSPTDDTPIRFVAPKDESWAKLPQFWNDFPPPAAGPRTVHLGIGPLEGLSAIVLSDRMKEVRIKVPLGLPDPNPLIPAANPPTFGKWQLGKKLFFWRGLHAGGDTYACADCHQPGRGFAQSRAAASGATRNTLSLINCVYNRQQFWDGRVEHLEETLARSLDDELPPAETSRESRLRTHRWGGLVKALAKDDAYRAEFERVFAVKQPTQDTIAKALATYLRTILSGNSIYDRAEMLDAQHIAAVLDAPALKALGVEPDRKASVAEQIARGHALFHGKAKCAACHYGPLFTDHDYHNLGFGEADHAPPAGKETGRFTVVPIGLKEARLIGAYRTPTLRNLPRTGPYFHHGRHDTLRRVIQYYDRTIAFTPYLAAPLRQGENAQSLHLTVEEVDALERFLTALDGTRVDPIVTTEPK